MLPASVVVPVVSPFESIVLIVVVVEPSGYVVVNVVVNEPSPLSTVLLVIVVTSLVIISPFIYQ